MNEKRKIFRELTYPEAKNRMCVDCGHVLEDHFVRSPNDTETRINGRDCSLCESECSIGWGKYRKMSEFEVSIYEARLHRIK